VAAPESAAILSDIDGTLAPIVARPEQAAVSVQGVGTLRRLSERFALVGCVSGRQAEDARRLVGPRTLAYAGNHGMELLWPFADHAETSPGVESQRHRAKSFLEGQREEALAAAGLRREDKDTIQALHWRGAGDEEAAEAGARQIAAAAEDAGLVVHWGRKVLELRPPVTIGKDTAVEDLLAAKVEVRHAIYAGDDRTDLDAFEGLRQMRARGELETAVCVGVLSAEGPPELEREADLTVDGPAGWLAILRALA